jgi:2-aminoadipate transaminase
MKEYNFGGGRPAPETFPTEGLAEAAQRVIAREGPGLVLYPDGQGYLGLREVAAMRYRRREGKDLPVEEICLTTGSMQAITLAIQALLRPGRPILCEEFCYSGSLHDFRAHGAELVGIPVDEEGLDVAALEETLRDLARQGTSPSFLYTIANHQNPTGTNLTVPRRQRLLELAEEYDVVVVEDDCYGDVIFEGREEPTLYGMDPSERVIYIASWSKVLGPGVRLGYFAARAGLRQKLMAQKIDGGTTALASMIVAEYFRDHFVDHLARTNALMRQKRDAMLAALAEHWSDLGNWTRPNGGLFLWLSLPERTDRTHLLELAPTQGVIYAPGRAFHARDEDVPYLRLAFGYPALKDIPEGVARLAGCVRQAGGGAGS